MILRRLIEHLRHEQWAAIAIELVIVVLGVFIGMQVSNWNQQRLADRHAADGVGDEAALLRRDARVAQRG